MPVNRTCPPWQVQVIVTHAPTSSQRVAHLTHRSDTNRRLHERSEQALRGSDADLLKQMREIVFSAQLVHAPQGDRFDEYIDPFIPRGLGCRNHGQSLRQLLCSHEDEADRDDVARMSTADAITALYSQLRNYPAAVEARPLVRRPAPIFQLDATLPASNQSARAMHVKKLRDQRHR